MLIASFDAGRVPDAETQQCLRVLLQELADEGILAVDQIA